MVFQSGSMDADYGLLLSRMASFHGGKSRRALTKMLEVVKALGRHRQLRARAVAS